MLWEDKIGTLLIDESYHLINVRVREYGGVKYLSFIICCYKSHL